MALNKFFHDLNGVLYEITFLPDATAVNFKECSTNRDGSEMLIAKHTSFVIESTD
jgi:hypothetical protein